MMKCLALLLVCFTLNAAVAQTVVEDCKLAQTLTQTVGYCSADGAYNNQNVHKSLWFQFTSTAQDVDINVSGAGSGGTLQSPEIKLYSDCSGTELVGTSLSGNNISSLYKGGLIIGNTYYIQVTGDNGNTGTFKLCINNYNPIIKPGQDCATASFLCSTATISQQNVSGAGLNNDEAKGTCLSVPEQVSESNSVWYKWQAANNGTLVFTITPTNVRDDIDWVLFDLGTIGDCAQVNPTNAIRCKAGYGVENVDCPSDALYYKTGLDFNETDVSEPPGCGKGQNGKLAFVTMVQGHYYALLINNFSSGNNGFSLAFTDQHGKAGTGQFAGPQPAFSYTLTNNCSASPQLTLQNKSSNYTSLKWSFGEGANTSGATGTGPYTISYSTPGVKTITLEAIGSSGCSVISSQSITVGIKPALPVITLNKNSFCINDVIMLSTTDADNLQFQWTGPSGFQSAAASPTIPVTGPEVSGTYSLMVTRFGCSSDLANITIAPPSPTPVAEFTCTPSYTDAAYGPVAVQFNNHSTGANSYSWNFGDGTTSSEKDPKHIFNQKGNFTITLTATNTDGCSESVSKSGLIIIENNNYIFIPNTFSPNGDGKNDEFQVTITNVTSYHIKIFDRWGAALFESTDINQSWKGDNKGQRVPTGTYFYIINAVGTDGTAINKSGYITIIR
ncbi:gliding motility-associated C-terminal domain-containing protein [Mucilaginibacter sp. BT774]|uniref:T9SS type B sorting domain-containing protein n=1 Tax=Mucilaginibacter sp. BT774 TaxID=3062276 RepID=UPI00267642F8|nr:gliding motility-associated C-terminal domain-containing protein [Mucilaginibacter sp. BT774]MDO3628858.1 gliding motility-associated C-terminal domain-containing protein [Mucilaginibacter sp. BT774]